MWPERRSLRRPAPRSREISRPSNTTRPPRGLARPTTALARVVLPEPVSPTRPTISPGHTVRLTPFSTWLARQPWPSTTSRSVTSSTGRAVVAVAAVISVTSVVIG